MKTIRKNNQARVQRQADGLKYTYPKQTELTEMSKSDSTKEKALQSSSIFLVIEGFNNEWTSQLRTKNKAELDTDPERRFGTKKQTHKPHAAFQMVGLRMRETVAEEERKFTNSSGRETLTEQGVDKTVSIVYCAIEQVLYMS